VAPRPVAAVAGWATPADQIQVGTGPVSLGEQPVLEVETSTPGNWRQKVYDKFIGRGWSVDPEPEPISGEGGVFDLREHDLIDVRGSGREEQYEVRLLGPAGPNILSAAPATRVELELSRDAVPDKILVDPRGTITLGRPAAKLQTGDQYVVTARVGAEIKAPRVEQKLRTLATGLRPTYRTPRLEDLVESITKGAGPHRMAKVTAIEDYLMQTCRYNARAPAVPPNQDNVVEYFLFNSREGYCDLFATALCVMCRIAGIPARFVTGFAPGEADEEPGVYVVRERDRHAWVEVELEDRRWATVDPAAGLSPGSEGAGLMAWLGSAARTLRRHSTTLGVAAVIVLTMYLIIHLHPRARREARSVRRTPPGPSNDVIGYYRRACRLLARRGFEQQEWDTPLEYLATCRREPSLAQVWQPFDRLTHLFLAARYARGGAGPQDAQRASLAVGALRACLRAEKRDSAPGQAA
jgi:hypothetical protein